jgi:hypothetical protein
MEKTPYDRDTARHLVHHARQSIDAGRHDEAKESLDKLEASLAPPPPSAPAAGYDTTENPESPVVSPVAPSAPAVPEPSADEPAVKAPPKAAKVKKPEASAARKR